jgi:hypothetical protein
MGDPIKNYTKTSDPNVVIGRHGAKITMQDFEHANKNGYAWKDFDSYADYVGGWARPVTTPIPIANQYRAYGQKEPINGGDIAILAAKNDPKVNEIITRNIAKAGEVPMYGPDDADIIKALIAKEKLAAQGSHYPDNGIYNAMAIASKKQ